MYIKPNYLARHTALIHRSTLVIALLYEWASINYLTCFFVTYRNIINTDPVLQTICCHHMCSVKLKCTKTVFGRDSAPAPFGVAYDAPLTR